MSMKKVLLTGVVIDVIVATIITTTMIVCYQLHVVYPLKEEVRGLRKENYLLWRNLISLARRHVSRSGLIANVSCGVKHNMLEINITSPEAIDYMIVVALFLDPTDHYTGNRIIQAIGVQANKTTSLYTADIPERSASYIVIAIDVGRRRVVGFGEGIIHGQRLY